MIVQFGNSELDTQVQELRRDGTPVPWNLRSSNCFVCYSKIGTVS